MFEVHVVREEKLWGLIVVMGRHLGMMEVKFGGAVEKCLGLFGERHL